MTREIPCAGGFTALVDDEDFERLSAFKWRAVCTDKDRGTTRPRRYIRSGEGGPGWISLYREMLKPPADMVVDHINGDPMDNRRCNLRVCTNAQNMMNQRSRVGKAPHKGVMPVRGKFRARIRASGRVYHLGEYPTSLEAALAYDAAALVVHGEFACLNVPDAGTLPRHPHKILADLKASKLTRGLVS